MNFTEMLLMLDEHWITVGYALAILTFGFLWGRRHERLRGILAYAPDSEFMPEKPHQGLPVLPPSTREVVVRPDGRV
jgi:hypothetical protein